MESENFRLIGYADNDWGGSCDDMRSTSGYVFLLNYGAFCWSSKKQEVVAQSTAEAEYISAAAAVNQAIWLRNLLADMEVKQVEPTEIFCDNQSAVAMANNPVMHGRTKHIKIKFHAVREAEQSGEIRLTHCRGEMQLADIFTKSLCRSKFEDMKLKLGVSSKNIKEECSKK